MVGAVTVSGRVHEFAMAVRAALADLPVDEVDELTEGLEADLADRVADGDGDDFGDPVEYADELRRAAGLAERGAIATKRRPVDVGRGVRDAATAVLARIRSSKIGAEVLELFAVLGPAFWLLRGWAVYELLATIVSNSEQPLLPGADLRWIPLLAVVVCSVQWGRGRWLPWRWLKAVRVLSSVATVVAVIPLIGIGVGNITNDVWAEASSSYTVPTAQSGVLAGGTVVSNIFAYGPDGKPLKDVRLFDDSGDPIVTTTDPTQSYLDDANQNGSDTYLVPSQAASGQNGWDVYPLQQASLDANGNPVPSTSRDVVPPFAQIQPLIGASVAPTPTAAMTPKPSAHPSSSGR